MDSTFSRELLTSGLVFHRAGQRPHQTQTRLIVTLPHPKAGKVTTLGVPVKLHGTPGSARTAPPVLGQHTDAILKTVAGLKPAAIARLRAEGAI